MSHPGTAVLHFHLAIEKVSVVRRFKSVIESGGVVHINEIIIFISSHLLIPISRSIPEELGVPLLMPHKFLTPHEVPPPVCMQLQLQEAAVILYPVGKTRFGGYIIIPQKLCH